MRANGKSSPAIAPELTSVTTTLTTAPASSIDRRSVRASEQRIAGANTGEKEYQPNLPQGDIGVNWFASGASRRFLALFASELADEELHREILKLCYS